MHREQGATESYARAVTSMPKRLAMTHSPFCAHHWSCSRSGLNVYHDEPRRTIQIRMWVARRGAHTSGSKPALTRNVQRRQRPAEPIQRTLISVGAS